MIPLLLALNARHRRRLRPHSFVTITGAGCPEIYFGGSA